MLSRRPCFDKDQRSRKISRDSLTTGFFWTEIVAIPAQKNIRIGTSGWLYPHWRGRFYPDDLGHGDELAYYARHFDSVEINNTFYRLPTPEAVGHWRRQVPPSFLFSTKMSRYATHMKKLKDPVISASLFLDRIRRFGTKRGPVLIQLPPRWHANAERLDAFLDCIPRSWRVAVEFRDRSWWCAPVYDVLRRQNAALCILNMEGRTSPRQVTADFVYLRLHGPGPAYAGRYGTRALRNFARWCEEWQDNGLDVFAYFNNDQNAFAVENARELINLTAAAV